MIYIDGLILLAIYLLACLALIVSIYNFFTIKELTDRLNSKRRQAPLQKILPPVVKRPKGHWD